MTEHKYCPTTPATMYGGYREAKTTEEHSNPRVPNSASKSQNTRNPLLRGFSSLPQVHTRPVRTKHLLDELREVYDDIDNSASKRLAQAPEDDPLMTWNKDSVPKGLEWMNPTPSKIKNLSSNTIPETVSSVHHGDVSHEKAGLLATGESQNLPETRNAETYEQMELANIRGEPVLPRTEAVNGVDKENIFIPSKASKVHDHPHLPPQVGLLSSSKKRFPSEIKPEIRIDSVNYLSAHNAVDQMLFTPLKRATTDSVPAPDVLSRQTCVNKIPSTPSMGDHIPLDEKSMLSNDLHLQQDQKKSPTLLLSEPHASLLTPSRLLSQPVVSTPYTRYAKQPVHTPISTPYTGYRKPPISASVNPPLHSTTSENDNSSMADLINTWKTPAKIATQLHPNYQLNPGPNASHLHLDGKKLNLKSKDNNNVLDVKSLKPSLPSKSDEAVPPEDKAMAPDLKSAQEVYLNSCPLQSKPVNPPAPHLALSASKGPTQMPPPSQEARKPPVKEINEPQNNVVSPANFSTIRKRSTNDQIFVNGKPYTVLSLLGTGGSSVVYLVLEPVSSKLLAVKCVNLSELDKSTYEGYLNEIGLLSQLQDSDCVIRMFDHQHCKDEKILYVVMEKGETDLSKLIRDVSRTKKVSPAMTVYYWIEMLNAVSFIHKRGTIHSDLKPANFLLVAGRLKLIDFGIASSIQGDMTSVVKDSMTGTYNYISPEALCSTGCGPDGKSMRFKISYKSDVWSLGCILYNLVYGHTPFQTITNTFMKMTAIANPNHKIPFPPAPGFPKALLLAMQACLVRNPKLRPSVDELLQYQYLGSAGHPTEPAAELLDQISAVVHSANTSDDKLRCLQTLLSSKK